MPVWPARLSVVVSVRQSPTSACWPSFPPTGLSVGAPFPPRGLVDPIPPLRRYYETLRFLAAHPPALRCLRAAVPSEHLRVRSVGRQVRRPRPRAWCAGARPPATFKMETMRPPGFPGNPPARMPRAPTPARSPPPRPLRGGDVAFRPTQDVGPRDQCISGLNHAGLRTPCERFAPWVTPGPRITRFRLVADLGRMGSDTHRVSNKVSKITSRHLVPLDRAFPAHALVHE